MPELPEVERVRRTLEPHVVGRRVVGVDLRRPGFVLGPPAARTAALLEGDRVVDLRRLGKSLALVGASGRAVHLHLGMTGQFIVRPDAAGLAGFDHVHVVWTVAGERGKPVGARQEQEVIAFRDPRRFGEVRPFATAAELEAHWARLGPDALTIDAGALAANLRPGKRAIKAALLDQGVLAGVGNIYADEALFLAGIHPRRMAGRLKPAEVERLAAALREVLSEAVTAGGSTLRDFVDADGAAGTYRDRHRVYGRGGLACVRCEHTLKSGVVAQRTTVWCPVCQGGRGGRRSGAG